MRKFATLTGAMALTLFLLAPGVEAQVGASATILATPGSVAYGYATPVVAIEVGEDLTFQNLDVVQHDVTARLSGPEDEAWCEDNTRPTLDEGDCPILWSSRIGTNRTTPVEGTENLEPGQAYPFYCSLHPWMNGVVVTEPV